MVKLCIALTDSLHDMLCCPEPSRPTSRSELDDCQVRFNGAQQSVLISCPGVQRCVSVLVPIV